MKDKPITDIHDLISKEVESHIRPFIVATFDGQERLYNKLDGLEKLVKRNYGTRTHPILNSIFIVLLGVIMLVFLTAC